VRIIDPSVKVRGSSALHVKGWVEDVPLLGTAHVRLEPFAGVDYSAMVSNVEQEQLCTVLPKAKGNGNRMVRIVRGKWKGMTGRMESRDKARQVAEVVLDEDANHVQISFDDVAECRLP